MHLAPDQCPVEEFVAAGLDPPFHDRVRAVRRGFCGIPRCCSPGPGVGPAGGSTGRFVDARPHGGGNAGRAVGRSSPGASAARSPGAPAGADGFSTPRGSGCSRAASHARSARVNRTRSPCRCRSRTMTWCRRARISASLSRSLIGSSRSRARVLVTPRYASRNSTTHRCAVLDVGESVVIQPRGSASGVGQQPSHLDDQMAVTRMDEVFGTRTVREHDRLNVRAEVVVLSRVPGTTVIDLLGVGRLGVGSG
jgi:hypothetical protein